MITATIAVQMATTRTDVTTRQHHTMTHGPLARLVRFVVAVGLTALVFWKSDPAAIVGAARGANLDLILVACLLVVLDRALMAYRWLTLLSPLDEHRRPALPVVMRIFFVSTFVGTFLPASVGGD